MVKLSTFLMATVAIVAVSAQGVSLEPVSLAYDSPVFAQDISEIEHPITTMPISGAHVALEKRAPTKKAAKPPLTKEQKSILDTHNKFRALHGAKPLRWDYSAANFGNNWLKACEFKHSSGPYGENLAAGYKDFKAAITGWYSEEKKYDYKRPGFSMNTGHFTQVVWRDTKSVGCAKRFCPKSNWTIYICNYYRGGNMVGDNGSYFRKNVLPKNKK
ncbi:hypothetical protein BG004_004804 [Podila humilis]|nr:hypothetical protein BG004_004804 [Podila humilis]